MTAPRRRRLARAAAVLGGMALALGALEVGLRLVGWVPTNRHALASFHDGDERFGWLGARGYTARFRSLEFDVEIACGEDGFRVPAVAPPPVEEAPRVAFLGDSFAWGWGVESGEVLTDVLQARLGTSWGVKNYGVNAFGTGQERLLLEHVVLPSGATRVVVLFFANDPSDSVDPKDGRRPWFRLDGERLVAENVPVAADLSSPLRRLSRASRAATCLRFAANTLSDTFAAPAAAAPIALGDAWDDVPVDWPVCVALYAEMQRLCAASEPSVDLRVLYVPTAEDVLGVREARRSALRAHVHALCSELGLPLLDPTEAFHAAWSEHAAADAYGRPFYFPLDRHWTAAGHRLVADELRARWEW